MFLRRGYVYLQSVKTFIMSARMLFLSALLMVSFYGSAQKNIDLPLNVRPSYKKEIRSADGRPGKNYWQNSANYTINIAFNPETRLITGSAKIDYYNNSPDTLREILFKLYPNLFKKGSIRLMSINPADITDGMVIEKMLIDGNETDPKRFRTDGTNMNIRLHQPLSPGGKMQFSINYSYVLNKDSHIRTGEIEKGADFVAYFFPRITVYDEIDGWNHFPYIGTQEFYNDFGRFNVSITVPANYIVWATGDLQNCTEVMNRKYCDRIKIAERNDTVLTIIDSTDLKEGNITKQSNNTWHFIADSVNDFAFAVSDHYLWKSSSLVVDKRTGRRTRVDAAFNPRHKDYFEVIDFARKTVEAMSFVFPKWPYPYSHETIFDGLDQMEYPMMVNDNPLEDRTDVIELTDHEIFHTMFPFYMGINETKHAWMDEGWATIGEWIISPIIDPSIVDNYGVSGYELAAGKDIDLPIITPSTQTGGTTYFINSYPKPALGYLYVKEMLGDTLFYKALHYYIQHWHGKHPIAYDFFNCMNTGSGKNLNWFWKKWFIDNNYPDLAIRTVTKTATGYNISIESVGGKPVPIEMTLTYANDKMATIKRNISVWEKSNTVVISVNTKDMLSKVELGGIYVPDTNRKDNVWQKK